MKNEMPFNVEDMLHDWEKQWVEKQLQNTSIVLEDRDVLRDKLLEFILINPEIGEARDNFLATLEGQEAAFVQGALRFRSQPYQNMLQKFTERMIKNYGKKQKFEDFVLFLQSSLETNKPRYEKLRVQVFQNGHFTIWDEAENDVTPLLMKGAPPIQWRDILINLLVENAPRRVVIGMEKGLEKDILWRILHEVFGDRLALKVKN